MKKYIFPAVAGLGALAVGALLLTTLLYYIVAGVLSAAIVVAVVYGIRLAWRTL